MFVSFIHTLQYKLQRKTYSANVRSTLIVQVIMAQSGNHYIWIAPVMEFCPLPSKQKKKFALDLGFWSGTDFFHQLAFRVSLHLPPKDNRMKRRQVSVLQGQAMRQFSQNKCYRLLAFLQSIRMRKPLEPWEICWTMIFLKR